jgi:hypothetical protein
MKLLSISQGDLEILDQSDFDKLANQLTALNSATLPGEDGINGSRTETTESATVPDPDAGRSDYATRPPRRPSPLGDVTALDRQNRKQANIPI